MSDSLQLGQPLGPMQRSERPGYFVQPSTPPRDITTLSDSDLNDYLRGFYSLNRGSGPAASPYTAQDIRLEQARRLPSSRPDEYFELEDGSNELPLPPIPPPVPPADAATAPPAPTERLRRAVTPPSQPASQSATPPPPPAPAAQQPSILDMLRQRMAREMEGEDLRRVAEFGRGMLASSSPNFFTMLAGGARAQAEGDTSRMERLRQLAETERQQRALEGQEAGRVAEEQYRQESLRLRREEAARAGQVAGVPLIDDQDRVVFVNPRTGETIRETNLRSPQQLRNQPRALSEADRTRIWNDAGKEADRLLGLMQGVALRPAQEQQRNELRLRLFRAALEAAPVTANSPDVPQPQSNARPTIRETYVPPNERR